MKLLCILFLLSTLNVFAAKNEKYGWVDMQEAIMTVKEGKRILKNLELDAENNQKQIQNEIEAFQKMKEEFDKKAMVMNEKTRNKKQLELQEAYLKIQQKEAQIRQEFQMKHAKASQDMISKVSEIVRDYAKKNGYKYVFEKNALIFKPDGEDLTKTIISLYDKKYK